MTNAMTVPAVSIQNGRAVTSTRAVAELFGKRHDNVLRAYAAMECSDEFTALNFEVSEYTDPRGRKLPVTNMTKDGFTFLAMGFTGSEAPRFKEPTSPASMSLRQTASPRLAAMPLALGGHGVLVG